MQCCCCGSEILPHAKFCSECGNRVDSVPPRKRFHYSHVYHDETNWLYRFNFRTMENEKCPWLKACKHGPHELIAYVKDEFEQHSVPKGVCGGITLSTSVLYKCRKCGDDFHWLASKDWGIVVEEHYQYPSGKTVITKLDEFENVSP